jgi:hypothetical protein
MLTNISDFESVPPKTSGSNNALLIVGGLVAFLLFVVVVVLAIVLISYSGGSGSKSTLSTSASPSPTAEDSKDDENETLKEKLANLEKQVEEQKKEKENRPTLDISPTPPPTPKPMTPTPEKPRPFAVATVYSPNDGFLAMRSAPSADYGERIAKIPHGSSVNLLSCQSNYTVISGKSGRWCRAEYAGRYGWVFDGFLAY